MSTYLKLIIPLIDKSLKLEDISDKSGFAGVYTLDKNKPWLTDHVFLLYKRTMEPESLKTRKKLSELPCLYSKRNIKVKDVLYTLFCFTINRGIRFIRKSAILLTKEEEMQICKFWLYTDADITDFLMGYTYVGEKFKDSYVPEEDFSPKDFITYNEKRGALVYSVPL